MRIAAAQGTTSGGGAGLALPVDLVIMGETATVVRACPAVELSPGPGATQALPWMIGRSGRTISYSEAGTLRRPTSAGTSSREAAPTTSTTSRPSWTLNARLARTDEAIHRVQSCTAAGTRCPRSNANPTNQPPLL